MRVAGIRTEVCGTEVQLYVQSGEGGELIATLPPGLILSEGGRWSAAFAVARDAVGGRLALVPAVGDAVAFTAGEGDPAPAALRSSGQLPSEGERSSDAEPAVRLARTLEDLADAEALVEQLRRRCSLTERALSDSREKLVQAWGEARELRDLLDSREASHELAKRRERDALDVVEGLEERAQQAEADLTARRLALEEQCGLLQAELEHREAAGAGAREELAAADERFQALQARSSESLERFERARSEAQHLKECLDKAEAVARRATGLTAQAGRELLDERAKSQEAVRLADAQSERLAKAERELGEVRQDLEEARARSAAQAAHAARLESELRAERHRAAEAERELETARERVASADGRLQELEAKSSDAMERLHEARSESEQLKARFAEATRAAGEAQRELGSTRRELARAGERDAGEAAETARLADDLRAERDAAVEGLQAELEAAAENLRAQRDAVAAAERELAAERARATASADRAKEQQTRADEAERHTAEMSAQLADSEGKLRMLATSEQALRQELELLTRTDLGVTRRARGRRSNVSSDAYREALASLEDERAERTRLEQEAARLAEQLNEAAKITVSAGGAQAGTAAETEAAERLESVPATIEADLRHLLAVTQRDLAEARAALNEQQARYAAVATDAASSHPTPPMPEGETAHASEPWSAVDEDLLNRISRAQEFAARD